ncbi:MAG TPA: hypothetical protein VGP28_06550 [Methylocella sp.]|nr:hypothetical protein [Methylocella sp.]
MLGAGLIVVRQDHDSGAFEKRRQFIRPLSGAHCIAGCGTAKRNDRVGAFFTFNNENQLIYCNRFYKFWQSVWNLANAFYVVYIFAIFLAPLPIFFSWLSVRAGLAIFEAANFE